MVKKARAFTLVELLITVAILAVLLGIGVANYSTYQKKNDLESKINELKSYLISAQTSAKSLPQDKLADELGLSDSYSQTKPITVCFNITAEGAALVEKSYDSNCTTPLADTMTIPANYIGTDSFEHDLTPTFKITFRAIDGASSDSDSINKITLKDGSSTATLKINENSIISETVF